VQTTSTKVVNTEVTAVNSPVSIFCRRVLALLCWGSSGAYLARFL
jgi:hypothetical protein